MQTPRPTFLLDFVATSLRHGIRGAVRSPLHSGTVILLLAIGLGATISVFTVVEAVLLTPLPYPDPERVVSVWETDEEISRTPAAGPNFLDWRERSRSFAAMAAVSPRPLSLAGTEEPVQAWGAAASVEVFDVCGVQPVLGRAFDKEDEVSGRNVAVLSHRLWARKFNSSRDVLGKTVLLGDVPHTIVGVMPAGFDLLTRWTMRTRPEVFVPLRLDPAGDRDSHSFVVLGRLAPGVTLAQARHEMDAIAAGLASTYPDTNANTGVLVTNLHEDLVGGTGRHVLLLFGGAVLVLLIACANVGGLLLGKLATRELEFAVRCSLGAGRTRVVAQVLLETLPLVLFGSAAGTLAAGGILRTLRSLIPASVPRVGDLAMDWRSAALALGLAILITLLLGIAPAAAGARRAPGAALKAARAQAGDRRRSSLGRLLVVTQVALTVVLASAAALMMASALRLQRTDLGFEAGRALTLSLSLVGPKYDDVATEARLFRDLLSDLRSSPGVRVAAASNKLPLEGGENGNVMIEGRERDFGNVEGPLAERSLISGDYFRAMGIPLHRGRFITDGDLLSDQPVAVVNQRLAQVAWPDGDPIGRRFSIDKGRTWITVVGVAGDVRQWGRERAAIPEYYIPIANLPAYWQGWGESMWRGYLVLQSDLPQEALLSAVKRAVWKIDPTQALADVRRMEQVVEAGGAYRRFNTILVLAFAASALALVVAALYGLASTSVTMRTREIGVRMALGADRRSVLGLILSQMGALVGIGLGAGLLGAFAVGRAMSSLLYGVSASDPLVLGLAVAGVACIGLLGCLEPAMRATRVNPVAAMRIEG